MVELYHVLNRGVDGRNIFLDRNDYVRFVHDLYEFNDTAPAQEYSRRDDTFLDVGNAVSHIQERIVDIHAWCLMKNHYHLLLSERVTGGIALFTRKLNGGYARGFNSTHKRIGVLFQGVSKKVRIERHAHFLYILHYIHLNPLDYLRDAKQWRERDKGGIHNVREVLRYLDDYRWSSFLDYCGKKNFPSILETRLFGAALGEYRETIGDYLSEFEGPLPDDKLLLE